MGKFSTLSVGISGLSAAQTGLYVTGHNMANVDTVGFTRQMAMQHDFKSVTIGNNGRGINQVGLGTDVSCIRQIRDKFLDMAYRKESNKYDFYLVKSTVGSEIETILGELQSQYNTDSVLKDLYASLQELSFDPSGFAVRGNFISTAVTFVDKVSNVYTRLLNYQYNLNQQVKDTVTQINILTNRIQNYNRLIVDAELAGDHANDYRDSMNVAIDQLSHLIKIEYKEMPNGFVTIHAEGKELVANGNAQQLGLRYCGPGTPLVEPVFTLSEDILSWDTDVRTLFDYSKPVNALNKNDAGYLKSLIASRGMFLTTYASSAQTVPVAPRPSYAQPPGYTYGTDAGWDAYLRFLQAQKNNFNLECQIPKVMQQFDTIVHEIVTMVNDAVAPYVEVPAGSGIYTKDPNAPYDLQVDETTGLYINTRGTEIFIRKLYENDRFTGNVYNRERTPESDGYDIFHPSGLFETQYTAGNIAINPALLEQGGYNLIALMTADSQADAVNGLTDNTRVLKQLLEQWTTPIVDFTPTDPTDEVLSIDDAYRNFIAMLGTETSEALGFVQRQEELLVQVDNKRMTISAVSLDEEMRNMMIYQHAYNAAARVINVVDSMIDTLINRTGR